MFTFIRYCYLRITNGIGLAFNNLPIFLSMLESPLNANYSQPSNKIDMDRSSLISEDESQINESNLELELNDTTPNKQTDDFLINRSNTSSILSYSPADTTFLNDNLEASRHSLNLNDTLETVEYMMERGLQILNKPITPRKNSKMTSTSKYDYVKSPISMYIKYSPSTPLRRNNNSNQRVCLEMFNENSIICENDENIPMETKETRCSFPRKAYKNSARKQIFHENLTQRRDGPNMQKLFGDLKRSPKVIKHYNRLRSKILTQQNENILIDDSFHDFSMDCGNISVHVVKSAKRN